MIDFNNAAFVKLKPIANAVVEPMISPFFVEGESILQAFQGIRDSVIFTNKRIIAINVQGMTGKKKDFTSMPYSKVQVYSVETAGTLDLDCELELWFSGVGKVKFAFAASCDVFALCRVISGFVL